MKFTKNKIIISVVIIVAAAVLIELSGINKKKETRPVNRITEQIPQTQFFSPTPTEGITIMPTYTPIPTPVASVGAELYSISDWSKGMSGWSSVDGWKTVDNMLVNDGSSGFVWIIAPFTPFKADYAVEAQIQSIENSQDRWKNAGIIVRGGDNIGYKVGFNTDGSAFISSFSDRNSQTRPFNPKAEWHTYRAEAVGNHTRLLIDGTMIIDMTDNQYLNNGQVGLWSSGVQLNVRSFKVINL